MSTADFVSRVRWWLGGIPTATAFTNGTNAWRMADQPVLTNSYYEIAIVRNSKARRRDRGRRFAESANRVDRYRANRNVVAYAFGGWLAPHGARVPSGFRKRSWYWNRYGRVYVV